MPYNTLQAMVAGGVDPRWADSDTNTRFHGRRVGPRSKQLPQRRSSQVQHQPNQPQHNQQQPEQAPKTLG